MTTFYPRACPRCNGDVFLNYDTYGWYRACWQCGWLKDADEDYETEGLQPSRVGHYNRKGCQRKDKPC